MEGRLACVVIQRIIGGLELGRTISQLVLPGARGMNIY